MITGEIRNQVDRVWDVFWTGGISNPLEVIEQLTYLLFIKRLDETQTLRENRARRGGTPPVNIFGPDEQDLRWSNFRHKTGPDLYAVITERVFPFIKKVGGEYSSVARHMRDARFTLPPEKAGLLTKVVEMLDRIPMDGRDTKGDLYEYLLSKLSTSGQNGQFRTPRHIIKLMVEMLAPTPDDLICDPACGTGGFLVGALEYLDEHYPDLYETQRGRLNQLVCGFDFDSTMLRIASMNLLLHGIDDPDVSNKDSLSADNAGNAESYTMVLANPPFKGSLDDNAVAKDLKKAVDTKKTDLLFMALFMRQLKTGGRAAAIVPDGVLFGSSKAHRQLRRTLVETHKLEGIVSMPSGVFRPYAGVSTAIVVFTKTNSGGTDRVWYYDMQADGLSLDDKRQPIAANDIPDILACWQARATQPDGPRSGQCFSVPKAEIAANDYDLSLNRYKQTEHATVNYETPQIILAQLEALEEEITTGLRELKEMLA